MNWETIDTLGRTHHAPVAEKIFNALCEHPYGLGWRDLAQIVYDGPDGGPDCAAIAINVCVCHMNKRFKTENRCLRVRGHGGPGSRYQIWIVR